MWLDQLIGNCPSFSHVGGGTPHQQPRIQGLPPAPEGTERGTPPPSPEKAHLPPLVRSPSFPWTRLLTSCSSGLSKSRLSPSPVPEGWGCTYLLGETALSPTSSLEGRGRA